MIEEQTETVEPFLSKANIKRLEQEIYYSKLEEKFTKFTELYIEKTDNDKDRIVNTEYLEKFKKYMELEKFYPLPDLRTFCKKYLIKFYGDFYKRKTVSRTPYKKLRMVTSHKFKTS